MVNVCIAVFLSRKKINVMEIKFTAQDNGFVVLPLEEYNRLKKIEKDAKKLWEEKRKNLLKGE